MKPRAHELKIGDVIAETADAVTLCFDVPTDLVDRFVYAPGQFLTVRVPSDRTGSVARCYSLSSSPHGDSRLAITIKRTPGGYASNWICDHFVTGELVTVLEPAGTFTPPSLDDDVMLCAAGSGITPIISIVKSILAAGSGHVAVLYANRDHESVIFADELDRLAREHPARLTVVHWLEAERGLPTADGIAALAAEYRTRDVYVCGPTGFTETVRAALAVLAVPDGHIHEEKYRSLTDNPFERSGPVPPRVVTDDAVTTLEVDIDGETHILPWPKDQKLLDVLLERGLDAPYVCRESACATCVCRVRSGQTRMLMNESLIEDEIVAGLTLACQTLPESNEVHIVFDQ